MTGLEIALFVLGAAFVIISFFIVDSNEKRELTEVSADISPELIKELQEKLRTATHEEADNLINETEVKLDHLTNDKIIAVNDFSEQVIEKINSNHQEVVFLYQMLKDKEEELKKTAQQLDKSRIECEKLLREQEQENAEKFPRDVLEKMTVEQAASIKSLPASRQRIPAVVKNSDLQENETASVKKVPVVKRNTAEQSLEKTNIKQKKPASREKSVSEQTVKTVIRRAVPKKMDVAITNKNDEILALYKKKKSIVEISRLLGMGQGEVKLIIDLYGK